MIGRLASREGEKLMKRRMVLAAVLFAGGLTLASTQTPPPPQGVAAIEKVKDNLYMITGGGGNTAAFIIEKGVVLVDTKNPNQGKPILDKLKTVTDKPVTMIINTHTHGDHVSGQVEFPGTIEVVAQENTKTNMEKMPLFQSAENKKFLPSKTYKDKLSLLKGKERIDLYYFGAGHTNGDTIVVFPALRTAHTGDLFATKGIPLIDPNNGGSGLAYPTTLAKAASGIKGVETVIPGHSPLLTWKDFQDFAKFMRFVVDATQAAQKAGKSADDAAASIKPPDQYKDYVMARLKDAVAKIYAEKK
jgi:glyoxylase-like metal-dependent hydrolase (beta-lactamase superfamily II)